jgi:hypothetical protein
MNSRKKGPILENMKYPSTSKNRSQMTQSIFVFLSLLGVFTLSRTHASEKPEAAEKNWTQAQQDYYQELKKLKTPRDPNEVKALKDKILAPKKKALEEAYQTQPATTENPNRQTESAKKTGPVEAPKTVLDGKEVKNEIRYTKKGAPADMTDEESPEFSGPEVISAPNDNGVGEIAYPIKKSKK